VFVWVCGWQWGLCEGGAALRDPAPIRWGAALTAAPEFYHFPGSPGIPAPVLAAAAFLEGSPVLPGPSIGCAPAITAGAALGDVVCISESASVHSGSSASVVQD